MKRLFWLATGMGLAALVFWQGKKMLRRVTPQGLSEQVSRSGRKAGDRFALFVQDVREAMAQREAEIHEALGTQEAPAEPRHAEF